MPPDERWRPGEGAPACALCKDAGWLRLDVPQPWERRPSELLKPCPRCKPGPAPVPEDAPALLRFPRSGKRRPA